MTIMKKNDDDDNDDDDGDDDDIDDDDDDKDDDDKDDVDEYCQDDVLKGLHLGRFVAYWAAITTFLPGWTMMITFAKFYGGKLVN